MHKNNILVFGGGSIICKGLIPFLEGNFNLINISLTSVKYSDSSYVEKIKRAIQKSCMDVNRDFTGVLVAYRLRETTQTIEEMVAQEITLLRTINKYIIDGFESSKTVVLGSITGERLNTGSSEAYHYQKDIQKSMVRYLGIQNPRHHINLIEINSCFRKYSKESSFVDYIDYCQKVSKMNPNKEMLDYQDLSETIKYHLNPSVKISGTIVRLDNGFADIQPI